MLLTFKTARHVLDDVIWLRAKLENETGYTEWRLYWIASVVLLRTVGHVAEKEDGRDQPKLNLASKKVYSSWKTGDEHLIFREFINKERNSILKEYATDLSDGPIPIVAQTIDPDGNSAELGCLIEENVYRPMNGGYYDGEDGRTLIDEAIEWWTNQLMLMEEKANA